MKLVEIVFNAIQEKGGPISFRELDRKLSLKKGSLSSTLWYLNVTKGFILKEKVGLIYFFSVNPDAEIIFNKKNFRCRRVSMTIRRALYEKVKGIAKKDKLTLSITMDRVLQEWVSSREKK